MESVRELTLQFNGAAGSLPRTDFAAYLENTFDAATARDVLGTFARVGLPAPQKEDEFLAGTEGSLLFLNRYGVVIRIEHKDTQNSPSGFSSDRIDDSPWVLRPLASIDAGKAVFEICPGTHTSDDEMEALYLKEMAKSDGVNFWDAGAQNIGRIPVSTPLMPQGIHVVIDRGAVNLLSEATNPIRHALAGEFAVQTKAAHEAVESFYGGLTRRFGDCWSGGRPMRDFWNLCAKYAAAGKLVAGWNEKNINDRFAENKKRRAMDKASRYEDRLRGANAPAPAAAPPQMRR